VSGIPGTQRSGSSTVGSRHDDDVGGRLSPASRTWRRKRLYHALRLSARVNISAKTRNAEGRAGTCIPPRRRAGEKAHHI